MIRRHDGIRRGPDIPCSACELPIRVGDVYRSLVAVREEWAERSFVRQVFHEGCGEFRPGRGWGTA